MAALESAQLLAELEPVVAENLDRHLAIADEWMPHEYVPWSLGRDFADLGGEPWSVEQSQLSPIARTALEVNLLTEDNLPSYHREIDRAFGSDSAWGTWVNRWTAEEGRHAFCIRDYLLVTRGVDPTELERARMETMETGYDADGQAAAQRLRLRLLPGARHPRLAPQHRPLHRGADRREAAHPGRQGREPAHDLLPQHRRRGARARAQPDDARDHRRGRRLPDARQHHPGLHPQGGADGQGRHLRPAHPPRRHRHARCCGSGASGSSRASTRRARRRATSSRPPSPPSTARPRGSSSDAPRPRPRRPHALDRWLRRDLARRAG